MFITKGRILIVDDEEVVRDVVGEMLSLSHYKVSYATNGHEGVNAYKLAIEKDESYGAVLMDLDMLGGMNGIDATNAILLIDSDARVVLSSGSLRGDLNTNYKNYGFSGILHKPYSMTELIKVIDKLIIDKAE